MAYTSEKVSKGLGSIFGSEPTQDIVDECEIVCQSPGLKKASSCSIGLKICNTYAISPEDLAIKWQALVINRTQTPTGSTIPGLDMGGVAELRDKVKLDLSAKPKQEQARHQQSTRGGAPLVVRRGPRQIDAGSGAGIKKSGTAVARSAPNGSGARSASSSLPFPIKILDNLEDRNCTCNESFYMHNTLRTV
jgi:hypothetical protein